MGLARCATSRRGARALAILVALLAVLVCAAPAAAAIDDEAAVVYDPHLVSTVDLTLSSEAIEELELEPGEYVTGTFEMATTSGGPVGEETTLTPSPLPVEARLKGSGSFRTINEKGAFKLKFKKATPFLGLRKMTLNNMVQDDSMAHEALTYLTFGALEQPASRSGYVYLRINGEDVGLYADVENLDKIALEKRFGTFEEPPQHLYEGESGVDVLPGEAESYEIDEGEDGEYDDLEALIAAVDGTDPESFSERVAAVADLEEMARMWAVEHYISHWDGYAGHREAGLRPNNYYLYSDAAGRFQMLPWGADQTWDLNLEIPHRIIDFDSEGGELFNLCLADEACFRLYWEALAEVTDTAEAMEAVDFLTQTAAILAPWQEKEREDGRAEQSEGQVNAAVSETATFIANRPEEARDWLAAHEPPPLPEEEGEESEEEGEESEEEGGGEEESGQPPAASPPPTVQLPIGLSPKAPSHPVRLGRLTKKKHAVTLRLGFATAGKVQLRGTTTLRDHRINACTANAEVTSGREAITCKLSPRALERLESGPAYLHLEILFIPNNGARATLKRTIRLPAL